MYSGSGCDTQRFSPKKSRGHFYFVSQTLIILFFLFFSSIFIFLTSVKLYTNVILVDGFTIFFYALTRPTFYLQLLFSSLKHFTFFRIFFILYKNTQNRFKKKQIMYCFNQFVTMHILMNIWSLYKWIIIDVFDEIHDFKTKNKTNEWFFDLDVKRRSPWLLLSKWEYLLLRTIPTNPNASINFAPCKLNSYI